MNLKGIVCGGLLTVALVAPASADPISGVMNITGSADVTKTTINWNFGDPTGHEGATDAVYGTFDLVSSGSGYFVDIWKPISGINTGLSEDLPPGGGANFLSDFETPFAQYDDLSFTLTSLGVFNEPVCTGAEQVGDSCIAFVGSPFLLTRTNAGTSVEFDVFGFFIDLTYGDDGSWNTAKGVYTAPNVSGTPKEVSDIINAGGTINSSYAAQYTVTAIPEPMSLTLLGSGLLGIGLKARRRRQSQS